MSFRAAYSVGMWVGIKVLVSGGKGGESKLNLNSGVARAEVCEECMAQRRPAIQPKALKTYKGMAVLALGMVLVCKACVWVLVLVRARTWTTLPSFFPACDVMIAYRMAPGLEAVYSEEAKNIKPKLLLLGLEGCVKASHGSG